MFMTNKIIKSSMNYIVFFTCALLLYVAVHLRFTWLCVFFTCALAFYVYRYFLRFHSTEEETIPLLQNESTQSAYKAALLFETSSSSEGGSTTSSGGRTSD